jgi:hypothetical protein
MEAAKVAMKGEKLELVMARSGEGNVDQRGAGAYGSARTRIGPCGGFWPVSSDGSQDADGE